MSLSRSVGLCQSVFKAYGVTLQVNVRAVAHFLKRSIREVESLTWSLSVGLCQSVFNAYVVVSRSLSGGLRRSLSCRSL